MITVECYNWCLPLSPFNCIDLPFSHFSRQIVTWNIYSTEWNMSSLCHIVLIAEWLFVIIVLQNTFCWKLLEVYLGHLSHSGDLLQFFFVRLCASRVVCRALTTLHFNVSYGERKRNCKIHYITFRGLHRRDQICKKGHAFKIVFLLPHMRGKS